MKKLGFLAIILLMAALPCKAVDREISTTHPQVAHVLEHMAQLYAEDEKSERPWNVRSLFKMKNAHHFEPTISDLKRLMTASPLIAGPLHHQGWVTKAEKSGMLPKARLLLNKDNISDEHFWLETKAACQAENLLREKINLWFNYQYIVNKWCQWISEEVQGIKKELNNKGIKRVILAHSALKKLFQSLGVEVLVLRSEDHHQEVSMAILKKATAWLEESPKKKVLMIKEVGFSFPLGLQRKDRFLILWSSLVNRPEPLTSLRESISKLKERD